MITERKNTVDRREYKGCKMLTSVNLSNLDYVVDVYSSCNERIYTYASSNEFVAVDMAQDYVDAYVTSDEHTKDTIANHIHAAVKLQNEADDALVAALEIARKNDLEAVIEYLECALSPFSSEANKSRMLSSAVNALND